MSPASSKGASQAEQETARADFSPSWFAKFPDRAELTTRTTSSRPRKRRSLAKGTLSPDAPTDRNGTPRADKVDLGPIEAK